MLGIVFFTSKSCRRLAGKMNLLFQSVRANFMLSVWTSRSVSPSAQRVARRRSPGLDRRFGMTLHYRLATSRLKRKRWSRGTRVMDKSRAQWAPLPAPRSQGWVIMTSMSAAVREKSSVVLDRELDEEKSLDPSGPRIRCPLCGWSPRKDDLWSCTCGNEWNTFDSGGVCPSCLHQWTSAQRLSRGRWSPHSDWYAND